MKTSGASVFLLFLLLGYMPLVYASPIFRITAGTDKPVYVQYERVRVWGTVTLEENPLRGLLVALEVRDAQGDIVAVGINQTDEDGLFIFAFILSPDTGSQNHTAYVSAQWESQIAMSYVTFLMEALGATPGHVGSGDQEILGSVVFLVLLVLFGVVLSSVSAILGFHFLELAKTEVETKPSIRLETGISKKYRTCVNCGIKSLGVHTFCRHCLTYLD